MGNSCLVLGRVMAFLIHEKSVSRRFNIFLDQIVHILAYEKAIFNHESFLKSSSFELLVGLVSFLS